MLFAFDYFLILKLKKFLIFLKKTLKSTYYQSEKYFITPSRVDRFALSTVYIPRCNETVALYLLQNYYTFFYTDFQNPS